MIDRQRPRILFLHPSGELYGSDLVLYHAVQSIARDTDVYIVLDYSGPLVEKLRQITGKVTVRELGVLRRKFFTATGILKYMWLLVRSTWWLRDLIQREEIDLVYTNTIAVLAGAFATRFTGTPHLWHVHEIITNPRWFAWLLVYLTHRFSDRVIVISHAVAEHLSHAWPKTEVPISIVHNGVNLTRFENPPTKDIQLEFGIDKEAFVIGLVGRVHYWKGQDVLIEAAHWLKQSGLVNFKVLIVGDVFEGYESLFGELRQKVSELELEDQIIFAGYRDDVPSIMQALDVVVVPSLFPEPFGLVILEGMAARKPVIATAHGGAVEIVVGEKTGYLVPPDDPKALANRLKHLADHPELRMRMGKAGYQRAVEHFTLGHFENNIRQVIRDHLRESAWPKEALPHPPLPPSGHSQ